jgi:hypothetical protein
MKTARRFITLDQREHKSVKAAVTHLDTLEGEIVHK